MPDDDTTPARRAPQQERARQTVEAVLQAVPRVLKRHGARRVTTNRIAEVAGVSIGSLYQYFPDKQAIFLALYERHVEDVRQRMERAVLDGASSSLKVFAQSLMEGLADVHAAEPELHELLSAALPESASGFREALEATFDRVLSQVDEGVGAQRILFVLPPVVEALVHAVPRPRPLFAIDHAKGEAIRTVLHYLDSCRS